MIRTQIYITEQENRALRALAQLEGETKSEIIRRILDERLTLGHPQNALAAARRALGAWRSKGGKSQLRRLRGSW